MLIFKKRYSTLNIHYHLWLGGAHRLEIYKRIRARREELGISQEELAKRMGYRSRSSINKIENGEDKEKVKKALELIFWDVKEKNKRKKD